MESPHASLSSFSRLLSNVKKRRSSRSGASKTGIVIVVVVAVIIAAGLGGIFAILFFAQSGSITPSGNLVTEEENFSDFTIVKAGSAFEIMITQSSSYSVSVTSDDNVIDFVRVSMVGDTLDIDITPGTSIISGPLNRLTLRVEITMPELSELELSGAADGVVTGFTSPEVLVLDLSGASRLVIDGAANDLILRCSGASRANLSNFRVHNAEVDLSGASRATINLDGRLDADVSGASTLSYIGEPTLGEINTSGISTVRKI